MDRYMAAKVAEHEEAAEPWVEDAYRNGKIFACTGGPGTGKTTVALACCQRVLELGGSVLFAYPTNRQASRMRAKLPPEVVIDTYHAVFGLDEKPGAAAVGLT